MKIGASSSCFYPLETEKGIKILGENGFKTIEIFFNAECELSGPIFDEIQKIIAFYGMEVTSVHPFTSFAESNMLFSACKRRFDDFREFYKKYYDAALRLGAPIVVMHGCKEEYKTDDELYIERFGKLAQDAADSKIILAQENVRNFKSFSPDFLCRMRDSLGELFRMVFDIKQATLAGYDPIEFTDKLGDSFVHLHLSDHTEEKSCLPPGKGNFDFAKFRQKLKEKNYGGAGVIELYSHNFSSADELVRAYNYLKGCGF